MIRCFWGKYEVWDSTRFSWFFMGFTPAPPTPPTALFFFSSLSPQSLKLPLKRLVSGPCQVHDAHWTFLSLGPFGPTLQDPHLIFITKCVVISWVDSLDWTSFVIKPNLPIQIFQTSTWGGTKNRPVKFSIFVCGPLPPTHAQTPWTLKAHLNPETHIYGPKPMA